MTSRDPDSHGRHARGLTVIPVDPIVLQVVEGTLASVEAEVEAAVERTSRSPMIR
jgi:N-methylhydantoinase B